MTEDPEIQAMIAVKKALEELSKDARERVLRWVGERYSVRLPHDGKERAQVSPGEGADTDGKEKMDPQEFEYLGELYARADPSTEPERALVSGYWFQAIKGETELTSRMVNDELKQLGHQVGHITRAFDSLMSQKPQLVVQLRKTGSTQQAHKLYRLTDAGIERVEQMVAGDQ